MIRTAQMLLAQTLQFHFLTRLWRRDLPLSNTTPPSLVQIQRMFLDIPDPICSPFSIHNILSHGNRLFHRNVVGVWFGPNEICKMIQASLHSCYVANYLKIYIAEEREINMSKVEQLCSSKVNFPIPQNFNPPDLRQSVATMLPSTLTSNVATTAFALLKNLNFFPEVNNDTDSIKSDEDIEIKSDQLESTENFKAVLILIPMRLGLKKIHEDYIPQLCSWFNLPYCVGIIGGKPRSSFYFIGYSGDLIFYLDPHTTQNALPVDYDLRSDGSSYFAPKILSMKIRDLDPTIALGLYCRNREELLEAQRLMSLVKNPLFRFISKERQNIVDDAMNTDDDEVDGFIML